MRIVIVCGRGDVLAQRVRRDLGIDISTRPVRKAASKESPRDDGASTGSSSAVDACAAAVLVAGLEAASAAANAPSMSADAII